MSLFLMGGIMADRFRGKVAIVTGAGSVPGPADRNLVGNGKAASILYAAEGGKVVLVDVNRDAAEQTRHVIEAEGGVCSVFQADVTRAADCQAMAGHCIDAFGRIDVLHHNVGIMTPHQAGIMGALEEDWDLVMNVNVKSIFLASRAVIPRMIEGGGGCILTVSALAAVSRGMPGIFIYGVSKAAVNALTKSLAAELAEKKIRVNCVMPGLIDTPVVYQEHGQKQYGGDIEEMSRDRAKRVPMKRVGSSWDTARAALFLNSEEASYITGQILAVDGGLAALAG
jgi:NAD(P)-dependent dehydrogenase (short-subunit alcohol dehydrogenase family)